MPMLVLETPAALQELVGREFAVSDWVEVPQERIAAFAKVTEDLQWIHVDEERARKHSPFGATIAHGFLTLSLLSSFLGKALQFRRGVRMGVNYGLNRVRFPSPVRAGARVRARFTLQSLRPLSQALEATYAITVEAEGADKPCCVAEWIVRYYA